MRVPVYEVLPFEGLAEARLGEDRAVLQRRLGEHRTFRKGATGLGLADQYAERGLILHHDDRGRLYYLEVSDVDVRFRGIPLVERPYGEVLADLAALGHHPAEGEFPELGFNLWPGDADAPDEPVVMVGMFERDRRSEVGDFQKGPAAAGQLRDHVLVPYEGTEQIRLGADRHGLRRLLGTCLATVPDYGPAAEDQYVDHGLHLGFDPADRLVSIAISSLARTVTYAGIQLYMRPYREVVADLDARGVRIEHGELIGNGPGFSLLLSGDAGPHLPVGAVRIDAG